MDQKFNEFNEFGESVNYWSMNWAQFNDPVSHICLAGIVVHPGLLQKSWQVRALLMTNIFVIENSVKTFRKNSNALTRKLALGFNFKNTGPSHVLNIT